MDIDDFKNDDHLLVSLLMNNDHAARSHVPVDIVTPLALSNDFPFRDIFYKHAISADTLVDMAYELLAKDDFALLRAFRYNGKLITYLYWQIFDAGQRFLRQYLLKKNKKNIKMVSDDCLEHTLIGRKDSSSELMLQDGIAQVNMIPAELWKKNPFYAFVLPPEQNLKLPGKLLGCYLIKKQVISIRAVRAKEKFYEYFKEYQT